MPTIFLCFLVFIVWLRFENRKSSSKDQAKSETFWSRERTANFTRNTDISTLNYITIPLEQLPFKETTDEKLNELQNKIQNLSKKKICNLTGYSNTDLKIKYGAGNITSLIDFDQNFTLLARTLDQWAAYLYQQGEVDSTKIILEYAVSCHTDVSKTYILLAQIYKKQEEHEKIKQLIEQVNNLSTLMKPSILKSLTDILA